MIIEYFVLVYITTQGVIFDPLSGLSINHKKMTADQCATASELANDYQSNRHVHAVCIPATYKETDDGASN